VEPPKPAPAPVPAEPEAPAAAVSIEQIIKGWPRLIEWMKSKPPLDQLRTRIAEKVEPYEIKHHFLVFNAASGFVEDQFNKMEPVRLKFQEIVQKFFHTDLPVKVVCIAAPKAEPAPAPTPAAPAPTAVEPAPAPPEPAPDPNRDIVGERMKDVFAGSEEITG
jgi:hypothetical protein